MSRRKKRRTYTRIFLDTVSALGGTASGVGLQRELDHWPADRFVAIRDQLRDDGRIEVLHGGQGGRIKLIKKPKRGRGKPKANKRTDKKVSVTKAWVVKRGKLRRRPGRPRAAKPLFKVVAEKIPWDALADVARDLRQEAVVPTGVYVAHDSMGTARYIGRGQIFSRLKARKRKQPMELSYFSFYIVAEKRHEREIETILIRAAGPSLVFNEKKKRVGISPGSVKDYEAGTLYYERQRPKGRKKKG